MRMIITATAIAVASGLMAPAAHAIHTGQPPCPKPKPCAIYVFNHGCIHKH